VGRHGGRHANPLRRGSVAAGAAALAWMTTLPVATPALLVAAQATGGCAGDDCDSDTATWGSCTQGERLDATHWESTPYSGQPWLNFHGERTWTFDPTPWMGSRPPFLVDVELSFLPLPNTDGGGGWAPSAGNLSEIAVLPSGLVQVTNDTCAQYYVRVVLTYAAVDAGAAGDTGDAGDAGRPMCGADAGG